MQKDNQNIRFRPITADDTVLLKEIYASTREEEMAMLSQWTDSARQTFLDQQFNAQHIYYQQQFSDAEYQIILFDDSPAGRLYVDRTEEDIHIIDIALLPPYRNSGIGGFILDNILREAASSDKTVSIHVERNNRALHLYQRLGFEIVDESNAFYFYMKWKPKA